MDSPTAWNINDKSDALGVSSNGLRVNYLYTGLDKYKKNVAIRANHPIPPQCRLFYFEVDIIDKGKNGIISVGFCTKKYNLNKFPSWKAKDSLWCYQGDDESFFCSSGGGRLYEPLFMTGDTIGCCLNFRNNTVFYTKNGVHLGIAFRDLKGVWYPCVGLSLQSESVEVNFGHKKFKYAAITDDDIDEFLKEKGLKLNLCDDELINDLTKSLETEQNVANTLRYRGKLYFVVGRYEQALADLTKLLEIRPNNAFALRYRGETYHMMGKYEESLADVNKLLEINSNDVWALNACKEVIREICKECGQSYIVTDNEWCLPCNSNHLQDNFEKWTSGNDKIDECLQKVQSNANSSGKVMEWIPHNRLQIKRHIAEGGFGTVYLANWLNGPINYWNVDYQKWKKDVHCPVALKILNNSNDSLSLLQEAKYAQMVDNTLFIRCLGFSQDPDTYNYILVMELAPLGSLYAYLNNKMIWKNRVKALLDISIGLENLHNCGLIHQDFHPGNLLFNSDKKLLITDLGQCKPANQNLESNEIYGVMPYVAPEVLRKQPYTQAADIYSLGMVMYFIAIGKEPFADCAHDQYLAFSICNGIRPEINEPEAPKCYIDLMKKCWDSNPTNRPRIIEVKERVRSFYDASNFEKQFKEAEVYRIKHRNSGRNLTTHPQAIYTSRLLNPYTTNLTKLSNNVYSTDLAIDFTKQQ